MRTAEIKLGIKHLGLPERPRIILALSDWMICESLTDSLTKKLTDPRIEEIPTEHEFVRRIPVWIKEAPDMFVIGCQMRWTYPGPRMPVPPQQVKKEGYENAGVRCINRLLDNKPLDQVPTVYFCSGAMFSEHSATDTLPKSIYSGEFNDTETLEPNQAGDLRKLFF